MEKKMPPIGLPSDALREIFRFLPFNDANNLRCVNTLTYEEFARRCSELQAKLNDPQHLLNKFAEGLEKDTDGLTWHVYTRELDYRLRQGRACDSGTIGHEVFSWWAQLGMNELLVLIAKSDEEVATERKLQDFFMNG